MPLPLIIGGVLLVVAVVVFFVTRGSGGSQSIEERLNELSAMGQAITLEELELSQPFRERVIVPMLESLSQVAQRFTPQNSAEAAAHKLELAGLAHKIKPSQFMGARVAAALGLGIVSLMIAFVSRSAVTQRLLLILGGFVIGFYLPTFYVSSRISSRQNEIIKSMPDALDLLTICVEAGLGFDAAMSKVAEKWDNELSRSFLKTVQEMQLGKLRREAMRSMSNSMDVADMTSFVAAIIQADQLGVSMAKVMRIQSDTMRMKRRQRAEEKARKAPIQMMFPLVFFIFPTILIVLLGPAAIKIKNLGVIGGG